MSELLELPGVVAGVGAAAGVGGGEAPAPVASVIGLDLSLSATGMSDGATTWLIRSSGKATDDLGARGDRLRAIGRGICSRIPLTTDLVLIEGPSFGSRDGHAHDRSGLWWLVVDSLQTAGVAVVEVTPAQVKKYATGKGNASKHEVIDATARRYPDVDTGANDNRADALWLAAIGLDHLTGLHVVPEAHRIALDKVRWPDPVGSRP